MIADLGDAARPYLKSWYAAMVLDPRFTGVEGMTDLSEVASADLDEILKAPSEAENLPRDSAGPSASPAETGSLNPEDRGSLSERRGERSTLRPPDVRTDASSVPPPTATIRGNETEVQETANKVEEQGPLGPILRGYEGRWREAALELERRQDGDAIGALHHKDVGPIDLVWGRAGTNRNNGAGLSKLLAWHPEVLNDLQGFIDRLTVDQELSTPRRIQLRDETGNAALRLDFDGVAKKWLLTAFEIDNRRATPSTKTLNELWGNAGRGARTDTAPAKPSDDRTSRGTGDDNISERLKDVQSAVVPALQQPADFDEILGTVDQDEPNEVDEEGWRRSEKSSRRLADLWADQSASASPPRGNIDEDGERRNERSTDRLADIWADASSAPPPSGSIAGAASEVQQRAEGGGMDASSNNAPDAAIQLQEGSDPNAAVRSYGIPAGAASIYAYRNDNPIKASSDYTAAKAGDVAAAARLVETLAKPEMLEQVKAAFGNDVVFAAPMAEEATGRNAIPGALSWLLAAVTGATVDTDIVQSSRAYHTGARPLDRLLGRPLFSGPVRAGAKYVLVDDVSVMGGTLAEMANHIRANGGEVAGVVTLVNASRTLHIAPTKSQVKEIERRFGDVVRETFGVEPTALTGDEAYFLLNVRDADTLRDRVAKAASERERRLFQKGVRASGAEEQQEVSRGDDAIGQNDVEQPDSVRAPDPVTRTDNDLKSIPPPAREYATALYDWGRASVLDAGRRTGHEYVMAIDGDGSIIEYGSAGLPNYSGMNDKLFGAMMNRDRNVLVIHNHPKNTPLSLADIAALAHPGMHAIWAIGHDGRDTRASLTPAARDRIVGAASSVDDQLSAYARLHQALSDAYATVAGFLEKRVIDGRLSPTTGRRAAYEALPLTSRKAGVIDYFTNAEYDPTTVAGLTGVLDTAAAQLKKDVFDGEGNQGLDNGVRGSSEPVRHIGDMERLEAPTGNGRPIPGTLPLSEGSQRNDQGQDGIWSGLERENRPVKATPANILQAVRDAVTDTVADADPTILAAVPLNYFPELAKGKIPAIDDYLRVKRMMDAYRGDKHDAAAQVIDGWRGIIASKAYVTIDKGRAQQISDVMHEATLAGIDPSITTAEEMSKPGYRELRAKYTALPPKARQLFQDVRDAYREQADELDELLLDNIRKAQQIALENAEQAYKRQLEDIAAQNLNPIDRRKAEEDAASKYKSDSTRDRWRMKARMTKLRQEFEQSRVEPPYFPLARFGRYFVVAKDIDGGVLHFSRHEKKADMTFALDAIRKELPNAVIQSGVIEQNKAAREAMDPAIVAKLDEMLKDANVDESVRDALYQRYLATMPDLSMRKRQIHRKGTPGFNRDAFRVFASTMFHSAHQMARLKYGLDLQENLNRAREQAQDVDDSTETMTLYNEFARRDEWVRNPTGAAVTNWITSAAFVWYMGASPAAALVNASQTVMLGVPMLGSRYGMAKASTELLKAVRQYAAGVGSFRDAGLTPDERAAMDAFHRSGLIDRTQSHDLAAVGETGTKYNPIRHRVMKIVGAGFHHIEVMNRSVTALAAYRLAREAGQSHLDAINSAHERTYGIHFDMSNSSRPRLMQNDFAKVALLFRSYNINLLYRLFRDIHQSVKGESAAVRREARAQLAGAVGMMTLMAGVTGSYGYGMAMAAGAILSSLFGDDDDDLDFETRFKADVLEMLGPELGGIVLNGVPGHYLGIDLTSRIGMPDLWFRSQNKDMSGEEWWNQFLLDGLGAGAGMVGDVIRGYDIAVNEGNVARGVEIMAPKAVRDLLKTLRYAQDGVTSIRGDEILSAQDLGAADLVRQAIGFTPARIAETYDRNNALKNAEIRINESRRKIINRFAKAVEDGDDEARAAVLADVREFNAAPLHRGVVISADTLKRSLKNRARNRAKREDGVLISNEVLGRDLRGKLPETIYR
ncbi:MAG: hypothetical protein DI528_21595 [Shinella sp.]|nr:MAG: hypothetical protein DI528_21595 [Shinella sp.]